MNFLTRLTWKIYAWIDFLIIDDIRFLFTAMNKMRAKQPVLNPEKVKEFKAEIKKVTPLNILKESWFWLLAIAFAAVLGWMLGTKYCTIKCNNYIIDKYMQPAIEKIGANLSNLIH